MFVDRYRIDNLIIDKILMTIDYCATAIFLVKTSSIRVFPSLIWVLLLLLQILAFSQIHSFATERKNKIL